MALVLNMPELEATNKNTTKPIKKQDTLFGPNIGIVTAGPEWTDSYQEKSSTDELTPEIVKIWVAKSKKASQPTTTLQALVNLKRPTLKLSPLAHTDESDPDVHQEAHSLEFEYDCDAPKCGIRVHVVLSPSHPLAKGSEDSGATRISVFEAVVDGGFGKLLTFEEGAVLELGQFESAGHSDVALQSASPDGTSKIEGHQAEQSSTPVDSTEHRHERKKLFTSFHFRNHRHHSVAGPALAVVDADVGGTGTEGAKEEGKNHTDNEGVKVIIKLSALDEDGHGLASANEQVTYLHVIRMGSVVTEREEGRRPWVVQVVKREATIGPHTFHLHEIYGLSSHSANLAAGTAAPAAPSQAAPVTHAYPPAAPPAEVEPSSECLLCLSSPREVVLLPCRHLVACRECAVNMVEYGAGGIITHADASEATTGGDTAGASEGGEQGGGAAGAEPAAPSPPPNHQRRKRRAKGWFCPVCRQPYTSLLRITTTLPTKEEQDSDGEKDGETAAAPLESREAAPPQPAVTASHTSRLASLTTPRFLRGFSRNRAEQSTPSDLERGIRVPATAA